MSQFELFFYGAEAPSWRKLLIDQSIANIALSYMGLKARLPKSKRWLLSEHFTPEQRILMDSGAFTANKGEERTTEEWLDYQDAYMDFVEDNKKSIHIVCEFDALALGLDELRKARRDFWDTLPAEQFMPMWHAPYGLAELEGLAERYPRVGVVGQAVLEAPNLVQRINMLTQKYGTKFHASGLAKPEVLRDVRFASAATSSWLSGMRYGETIVWDGTSLKRYQKKQKDQARARHRMLFSQAGFDADLICNDDPHEVARFTLWSWERLAEDVARKRGRPLQVVPDEVSVATEWPTSSDLTDEEEHLPVVATDHPAVRKQRVAILPAVQRPPEERSLLPGMAIEQGKTSEDHPDGDPLLAMTHSPLMACNTCYVASNCPEFKPGSTCAFEIPVQIRTREQLTSSMATLTEMQMQRVLFARYIEQQQGGYPDPNLSQELDRYFTMLTKMKEVEENRESLRMTLETRGNAGVISRIFGEKMGVQARGLPEPIEADSLMRGVLDVDPVN